MSKTFLGMLWRSETWQRLHLLGNVDSTFGIDMHAQLIFSIPHRSAPNTGREHIPSPVQVNDLHLYYTYTGLSVVVSLSCRQSKRYLPT